MHGRRIQRFLAWPFSLVVVIASVVLADDPQEGVLVHAPGDGTWANVTDLKNNAMGDASLLVAAHVVKRSTTDEGGGRGIDYLNHTAAACKQVFTGHGPHKVGYEFSGTCGAGTETDGLELEFFFDIRIYTDIGNGFQIEQKLHSAPGGLHTLHYDNQSFESTWSPGSPSIGPANRVQRLEIGVWTGVEENWTSRAVTPPL